MMKGTQEAVDQMNALVYQKAERQCTIKNFDLTVEKGVTIKVFVIKPNDLPKGEQPAYIYAHGGGAVFLDAQSYNGLMCHTALNLGCVVFNVDYRKGPEAKAPKG